MNSRATLSLLLPYLAACALATAAEPAATPAAAAASAPASAASEGWKVAYSLDPAKADKIGPEWVIAPGATATVAKGALVIKPAADAVGDCQVLLKTPVMPRSVKVEFDAVLEGDSVSDISIILNGDSKGYANGYLLQFGGKGNTVTRLVRAGEEVAGTVGNATIKAGQKYHIVAQNLAGKVSLSIDGKEAFRHADPDALEGQDHDVIGFYTFGCTMTISKLVVFDRPRDIDAPPATRAVDEKAVAELITQLGDDSFKAREAATMKLIEMGRAIHPILKAKLEEKGLDLEVSNRIQAVLKAKGGK